MKKLKREAFAEASSASLKKWCKILSLEDVGPNSMLIDRICEKEISPETYKSLVKTFGPAVANYFGSNESLGRPVEPEPKALKSVSRPAKPVEPKTPKVVTKISRPAEVSDSSRVDQLLPKAEKIASAISAYGGNGAAVDEAFLTTNSNVVAKAFL